MTQHLSNKTIQNYLKIMKTWDNETKKEIIIELTKSIDNTLKEKDFSDFFGKWEDSRSADEIINDIKNSRILYPHYSANTNSLPV